MADNYLQFSTTVDFTSGLRRGARPLILAALRAISLIRDLQQHMDDGSTADYDGELKKTVRNFGKTLSPADGVNEAQQIQLKKVLLDVYLGNVGEYHEDLHWEINSATKELSVTLWAAEHGDVPSAVRLIQVLLSIVPTATGSHTFQWAEHCSRSVPDAFGGGTVYVTATKSYYLGADEAKHILVSRAGVLAFQTPFTGDPSLVPSEVAMALLRGLRCAGIFSHPEDSLYSAQMHATQLQQAKVALLPVLSHLKDKKGKV